MGSFKEVIKSTKPVLVDFYADWCGPCKMMTPILKQLKDSVKEDATIIKIDIDKNPQVAEAYQVQAVPTLMVFQNGEIKWRQPGVVQLDQLKTVLEKFKKPSSP